jgi:non-specific serine/threonine protein kinase
VDDTQRYRIERELGRGGMATVYLAEDVKHRRKVALKLLDESLARASGRERFAREIEIAAGLAHPHIVPLYDSGADGDRLFYVMPYVEGETLRERLRRESPLPLDEALRIARDVASALAHAHRHGVVHRDIKPENVLLADGIARVTDFGIARALDAAATSADADAGAMPLADAPTRFATAARVTLGTPAYMSPEQVVGGAVDARSDLYALAAMLYEMIAGQTPFVSPTPDEVMRRHCVEAPQPLGALRADVPPSVAAAVERGLAKSPAERQASAAEFAESLVDADAGLTVADRPIEAAPASLPRPRTAFIGRDRELAEIPALLASERLVTLLGVGGSGKTRLALEVASSLARSIDVRFVDLSSVSDATRVVAQVAAAFGVREEPGKDLLPTFVAQLAPRRALVVLDNCEHVLGAASVLIDALLASAPEVRVLVTSREAFGVEDERTYAVRTLGVPDADAAADLVALERSDAVRLFADRARAAAGAFSLDARTAPVVAEICRRLDGIPLAIELAAARTKLLSVEQVRDKLGDRFRLLTGGRAALARHQTLAATLQWSYDLLEPEERSLLRSLSVFAGGATLDTATRVASDAADEFDVLDRLTRLADKSLAAVERADVGRVRYRLLETVRQYALEKLAEAGEADAARARHLAAFLALAEQAYPERDLREEAWASELEAEHDNLSAALAHAHETDRETALRIAGALTWFWRNRTHLREAQEHLARALAGTSADPERPARARAMLGAASVLAWRGENVAALRAADDALAVVRRVDGPVELAMALETIGWLQFFAGEDERARASFQECLALQTSLGNPYRVNRARVGLAQMLVALDEVTEATRLALETIAFSEAHDDRRSAHFGWHYLADCALIEGRYDDALLLYRKALVLAHAIGDRVETGFELQGIAMSRGGRGEHERAVFLEAAVAAEMKRLDVEVHVRFWDALIERFIGASERAVSPDALARVRAEGRRTTFEDAIRTALEGSGDVDGDARTVLASRGRTE